MRLIAAFLFLCSAAYAQPTASINGPTTANVGDILILDASESKAEHYSWLVDVSGVSVPNGNDGSVDRMVQQLESMGFKVQRPAGDAKTKTHLIIDGGKKLLLASYPGTWRVSLAVSDSSGVAQLPWRVVVGGDGPKPPPKDDDDGDDNIDTDLTALAKQWFQTVPADARPATKDLRDSITSVAETWKGAGSIAAMELLLENAVKASLKPLGQKATGWQKFFESADDALEAVKAQGATAEEYSKALLSIAKGME